MPCVLSTKTQPDSRVLVTAIHGFMRPEGSVDARVSAFGRPGHDDVCE